MAKVVMPLLSAEASGKIADTMVFFYWKGRNVVRRWVTPTNPRSAAQKNIRTRLAAMGKNLAAMVTASPYAAIVTLIRAATPANQIWNAYFVKQTVDFIKSNTAFTDLLSEYTNAIIPCTEFELAATTLLMATMLTGDTYDEEVSPGFQLFLGAYAAYKLGLCGAVCAYTEYPTAWITGTVTNFAKDYTTA